MSKKVVVIGGGPAGYTCALYGARAGLNVVVFEKFYAGGQMAITEKVENYPGFELGIDGFELAEKMKNQAERFGVKTILEEVSELHLEGSVKKIIANDKKYLSKTVVIATGANPKELGIANEEKFKGRGVHYCASCDGMFYKNKTVAVIGGGDTAVGDAILLSRVAKKVYLIHRRDTFKATKIYHDTLFNLKNVSVVLDSQVVEIKGENSFEGIVVENAKTKETTQILCDGLFVSIGRKPGTKFVENIVDLDENGYVIAGEDTKTNLEGVYAIGDVRTKPFRQVVTAVGDGANAIYFIETYLSK